MYNHVEQIKTSYLLIFVIFISGTLACVPCTFASENSPVILEGLHVTSMHWGADDVEDEYAVYSRVRVSDPQGLGTISSVTLNLPDGTSYATLLDDGGHCDDGSGDGIYGWCGSGNPSPPRLGDYTIVVTDDDGNFVTGKDSVERLMDFPENPSPGNGTFITNSLPAFRWDAVGDATIYYMEVRDSDWNIIWFRENITETSVSYNDDGTARSLTDGNAYNWGVGAKDEHGNTGWHRAQIKFVYSTTGGPFIAEAHGGSSHWSDGGGEHHAVHFWDVRIVAQETDRVTSVIVRSPDGSPYVTLYDDGNHGDRASGDNIYGWNGNGEHLPHALGSYTVVVTGEKGNFDTETIDVERILDMPRNPRPSHGTVVAESKPTLAWDAVDGTVIYNVEVRNADGDMMWKRGNISETSVNYNDDGTGQSLTEGNAYGWGTGACDDEGNCSWHHAQKVVYSTETENPLLISPVVRSRHWIGSNWENWGIDFWVNVADPQGLDTVESVWAEGSDGIRYELHDDGEHHDDLANDGKFANWIGGMSEPPSVGIYTFKAEDDTGNIVSATDTLTAVLDSPGNVTPANDTIVSEPNFIFNWDAVPGATWYEVQFVNMNWDHTYWCSGRGLTQTSVRYNEDGTGEALTDGGVYKFTVRAGDGKNESENIVDRIAYRTDGQKGTIHVDVSNTSGMCR